MATKRYLRSTLGIDVGIDSAKTQKAIYRDKQLEATMGNDDCQSGSLGVSETYVITFDKVTTARVVYIESVGDVEVRLNGAGSGPLLKTPPVAVMPGVTPVPGRWYLEASITSITLVNPSLTVAVDFVVYLLSA